MMLTMWRRSWIDLMGEESQRQSISQTNDEQVSHTHSSWVLGSRLGTLRFITIMESIFAELAVGCVSQGIE